MRQILLILSSGLLLPIGMGLFRMKETYEQENNRRTFILTFPADLNQHQVEDWLRSISGIHHGSRLQLSPPPTIVFELWASAAGLVHRIMVPEFDAKFIVGQLRSLIPGATATPEEDPPVHAWARAIELGSTAPAHTLHIPNHEQLSTSLLAAMQGLVRSEAVLCQLVVTSGASRQPLIENAFDKDALKDRKTKIASPNMLGVLRIAARGTNTYRTAHLIDDVHKVLRSIGTPYNRIKRRRVWSQAKLLDSVSAGRGMFHYPMQFSTPELTSLIGWPLGSPHIAGLPITRTRHMPATEAIPRDGAVFAHSNFPGSHRPLSISAANACKHMLVVGPPGSGKTIMLSHIARQRMEEGYGVVIIESKRDLFEAVLDRIPKKRMDDVILLDIDDATSYPVGFNVLKQNNAHAAIDELAALMTGIYGDSGVYTQLLLYHGLHALSGAPGATLVDLPSLLSPRTPSEEQWRRELVDKISDREIWRWWNNHLGLERKEQDRMAGPVHNRIWQLTTRAEIRNILGQSNNSFTFEQVIREKKILLVNLNGVRVGAQTASITGTMLVNSLWHAIRTTPNKDPVFLFLDEFQDFLGLTVDTADMLAKARSFLLPMTLAHQFTSQLPTNLRAAVLSNARSKIVFQAAHEDARIFAKEFGHNMTEDDFIHLGQHEVIARVATDTGISSPVTGVTLPPSEPTGLADTIRERSRARYGRPIADVINEQENRRGGHQKGRKKSPKLGAEKWDEGAV